MCRGVLHGCHIVCKVLLFIVLAALFVAALVLLIMGSLCFSDPTSNAYCSSLGYGGYLGFLVSGSIVTAACVVLLIVCCCCCCFL